MRPTRAPFLGDLELAVMEHLWDSGEGDTKTVHGAIGRQRRITANTVQSTLKRLFEKSLLTREKVSHAYVYAPKTDRETFHRTVLQQVMGRLMKGEADAMLTAFVDLTERAGAQQLERLERLVAKRRREGSGENG